jgi:ATP adenylyltransferase
LLQETRREIVERDPAVVGFNIGVNIADVVGQTIFHCHVHLIPRRPGDVANPRGEVRGVIPGKADY